MVHRNKSYYLWLIFLTSYMAINGIEEQRCLFDYSPNQVSKSCGYCGVCKKLDSKSNFGVCDDQYLTRSGLFTSFNGAQCELKNHCKSERGVLCKDVNTSTGLCHPLYGTYRCQCIKGFFGKHCENKIDLKTTQKRENKDQLYADVSNVVFTPIFYSKESASVLISLLKTGFSLKIYVDNGREQLIYNKKKCEQKFELLNQFCSDLFREANNIRLCRGMTSQRERQFKRKGCLISLTIFYPPRYDKNIAVYKYTNQNNSKHIMANLETASVALYNNFGNSINKPVLHYTFDMINIHRTSDLKSGCSLRVELLNCGKTMASSPKISKYSDMAILWSLEILAFALDCVEYGKVGMSWKVWRLEENHDELKDKPLLEMYQRKLFFVSEIPLTYGMYKVKLTLAVSFSDYVLREDAYCYYEVVRFPLQIRLLGGSLRKVYYKKPLLFQILLSVIPDRYEPEKYTKTDFIWRCDHPQDPICKPFKTSARKRKVTVYFPKSGSYKFTLDSKTAGRSELKIKQHQETQVVEFSHSPVVSLLIDCLKNCGGSVFKSNPQEIIHLKVSLEEKFPDSESLQYNWKYKCLGNAQCVLQEVDEIRIEDYTDNTVLVVDNNKLNVSSKYLFVVSVDDFSSYAAIVIETDQPPSGISCEVDPKSGIRGTTFFSVSCQDQSVKSTFPSPTFEFFNRNKDDVEGRMLGYSITGNINRIVLTRDKLFVRITNFFGSSSETEILIKLKPPSQSNSSSVKNVFIGNYIDEIGLLSSQSDLDPSQLFWDDSTAAYLWSLLKQPVHELRGAIMLQNTLHQIACEKLIVSISEENKFNCSTILNVASIMFHATKTITDSLASHNRNPRLMNTMRTKNFVKSVLQCSSVVLELNLLNKDKSSEIDVHDCLKTSTLYTIDTLTSLGHLVALQIFPSIKQWYESKSVHIFVHEITPGYLDSDFDQKTSALKKTVKDRIGILEGIQYYNQIIIFGLNPFWWGSGNKVNTNVFSVTLYKENKAVTNNETKHRRELALSCNTFRSALVSGYVTQLDPNEGPEVSDFKITIYRIIPEVHSKTFVNFNDLESSKTLRVLILKNVRPDFDLMNTIAVNVTENSNKLTFETDSIQDDSFYYIGILPGSEVEVGGIVNYTFDLISARCVVWNQKAWMSGSKCIVDDLSSEILICSCTLLSLIIGGYVYIPTYCLNSFSNLSLFLKTPDNPFVISFLLVVFSVFSILLIWTRAKDQEDKNKVCMLFLEDNNVGENYVYLVGVFTGSRIGASTSSNVGFKLFGEKDSSRTHIFSSSKRPILRSGSDDWFLLFTPHNLGALYKIQLWIDYSGSWPNWYCKMVFVCDISKQESSIFTVEKWFGINIKEICLDKIIKPASLKEINTFSAILSDNIVYGFRDLHFFVSLFHKHPRSVVTRTQRLSVTLSTVLLSICVSILLYSISTPLFEDFPAFYISSDLFLYSFVCSTIASFFGLINMSYFRRSFSIKRNTNHLHFHGCIKQCTTTKNNSRIHLKDEFKRYKSCKKNCSKLHRYYIDKCINPCYFIPVIKSKSSTVMQIDRNKKNLAWMITVIVIVASSYTIIVSSLTFGEVKTSIWMTCLLISLLISIFVFLSMKVIFISLICSLRKVRIFGILSHSIKAKNLSLNLEKETYGRLQKKLKKKLVFDTYRANKVQQTKMVVKQSKIAKIWVAAFIIESSILLALLYLIMGDFKTFKYFQSSSTVCNEVLSKSICEDIYYSDTSLYSLKNNVLKSVLPKLYKTKWYNNKELSSNEILFRETGWLSDRTSRLIGYPQLLQVRVQKNLCKVPSVMSLYAKNCFPVLSPSTMDQRNHSLGWTDDDWTAILFHESPWTFNKGVGLGVKTSSGFFITEGGYMTSLLNTLELAKHVTTNLIDTNWMDEQTRIIVLKFLTYNPNNNIFTSSYFITEVFPTHFIKTAHIVKSIGFYYHKLSFQGTIFILFSIFFFLRLLVTINIMGVNTFFKEIWNCYDVFIFCVYSFTVVDYVQLMYLLGREEKVMEASITDKNVHLERVFQALSETTWSLCFTFVSVAIRFVRITRINERCRQYLNDFVETKTELFWTMLISFIGLYKQFRLIMYFIEPPSVYDVVDILGFTSKYHPLEKKEYHTTNAKIVAFILFRFSEASLFTFTISLIHHHRQVKLRSASL